MKISSRLGKGLLLVTGLILPSIGLIIILSMNWPFQRTIKVSIYSQGEAPYEPEREEVRFVIGSMMTPSETVSDYKALVDYVSSAVRIPMKMVLSRSYAEANEMLRTGYAKIGFICTGAYASMHDPQEKLVIATPIINFEPQYQAYLIVHAQSSFKTLFDLKGHSIVYVDPFSLTGRTWVYATLKRMGFDDARFFSDIKYTGSHDKSIFFVAYRLAESASVDSVIFDKLVRASPDLGSKLRIIEKSDYFPAPPVVASPLAPTEFVNDVRKALIHMSEDPHGKIILNRIGMDGFRIPEAGQYNKVRSLMKELATHIPK